MSMLASANRSRSSSGRASTVAVSLAAIGSVLAASSCCLPLFPFMMAAGLAGTSTFLSQVRPYLLVGSILFIAFGFPSMAREKMPASNEPHLVRPLVGLCSLCIRLDLFPADHGERDSRFRRAVIYESKICCRRGFDRPIDRGGPLLIWWEPDSCGPASAAKCHGRECCRYKE